MSDGWREKVEAASPDAEAGNGDSVAEEKNDVKSEVTGTSGSRRKPVTDIRANISNLECVISILREHSEHILT